MATLLNGGSTSWLVDYQLLFLTRLYSRMFERPRLAVFYERPQLSISLNDPMLAAFMDGPRWPQVWKIWDVFLNFKGAQESTPRNLFRQPM